MGLTLEVVKLKRAEGGHRILRSAELRVEVMPGPLERHARHSGQAEDWRHRLTADKPEAKALQRPSADNRIQIVVDGDSV